MTNKEFCGIINQYMILNINYGEKDMKKYSNFLRITALLVMVIITCSGCGLLNFAGTLNNGTVVPTNPPAGDV